MLTVNDLGVIFQTVGSVCLLLFLELRIPEVLVLLHTVRGPTIGGGGWRICGDGRHIDTRKCGLLEESSQYVIHIFLFSLNMTWDGSET